MSVEVLDRLSFPYAAVVSIEVTFPDGQDFRGTGAVVGVNDVLTATHVMYSPNHGGWATSLEIYPGADFNDVLGYYEDKPYTFSNYTWRATAWPDQAFSHGDSETFIFSEVQYDVAIIGLSFRLGDRTGWFGRANGYDSPQWAHAVGYPDGSTGMMEARTWVTKEPGYSVYSSYANNSGDLMGSGSSGGPLYVANGGQYYIIGVKSSGTPEVSNHWADIGLLYDKLSAAIESNDDLLPPLLLDDFPNNTGTNGHLAIGGSMSGNIEASGDTDWFRVSLSVGFTYEFSLTGKTGGGGTINDPMLRIMNAASREVGRHDDISWADSDSRITFTAPAAGTYYLEAGGALGSTGTYTLSAYNLGMFGTESGDYLVGESSDDVVYGMGGNDILEGGAGNDRLVGGFGDDRLVGGVGIDTGIFTGYRSSYVVRLDDSYAGRYRYLLSGPDGNDVLTDLERLQFADAKVALDLGPDDNAGKALKFIGTLAFGLTEDPATVGAILSFFDDGYDTQGLFQLALDVSLVSQLAGSNSDGDLARLAYRNVVGTEADDATAYELAGYLDGRYASLSDAQFLSIISEMEINQTHIDLVGLQQTGVEFF